MFLGPGWFVDIINVKIFIDGPRIQEDWELNIIPWHPYKGTVAMCSTGSTITGKIVLTPPPSTNVWHGGIKVQVEEYAHFADPFANTDYLSLEKSVSSSGYIDQVCEVPFSIDLTTAKGFWHETYHGKSFSLRHMLTVTVQRPWYTFAVVTTEPLHMFLLEGKPDIDSIEFVSLEPETPVSTPPITTPLEGALEAPTDAPSSTTSGSAGDPLGSCIIKIADFDGVVALDIRQPVLDVIGVLRGTLTVNQLTTPIVLAQIALLKGEFVDNDVTEGFVFVHTVFGLSKTTLLDEAKAEEGIVGISKGFMHRQDLNDKSGIARIDDPVITGAIFEFEVNVQASLKAPGGWDRLAEICPTFDLDPKTNYKDTPPKSMFGSDKEHLGVRYFLRLMVQDSHGQDYWNTQEIWMYRSGFPASISEESKQNIITPSPVSPNLNPISSLRTMSSYEHSISTSTAISADTNNKLDSHFDLTSVVPSDNNA